MSDILLPGNQEQADPQSDWLCVELTSGKKLFLKLPYDPFSNDTIPMVTSGMVEIKGPVFTVFSAQDPQGRVKVAIMDLSESPVEPMSSPYFLNMAHVSLVAKLDSSSQLYQEISTREGGVVRVRPTLWQP